MKFGAADKRLDLDLRNENDLARSHFLHGLALLGVAWGKLEKAGNSRGTFRESWTLRWEPGFVIAIIDASRWGSTLEDASIALIADRAARADRLDELAQLIDVVLLANLQTAVEPVSHQLEQLAAVTGDMTKMLQAIGPLANVFRYSSVRKTSADLVCRVLDGMIARACIGLPQACCGIGDEAAASLHGLVLRTHDAVGLRDGQEQTAAWRGALDEVSELGSAAALLRGTACRLLLDAGSVTRDDAARLMSLNLSRGSDPGTASAWLDGFLNRNAMVLLNDETAWGLVDDWLAALPEQQFVDVLALVRRTFSAFTPSERRDIAAKARQVRHAGSKPPAVTADGGLTLPYHPDNVLHAIPTLRTLLGLPS
jgi:hypothetical protein